MNTTEYDKFESVHDFRLLRWDGNVLRLAGFRGRQSKKFARGLGL
jgi:hypothetical protein